MERYEIETILDIFTEYLDARIKHKENPESIQLEVQMERKKNAFLDYMMDVAEEKRWR